MNQTSHQEVAVNTSFEIQNDHGGDNFSIVNVLGAESSSNKRESEVFQLLMCQERNLVS